VYVCPVRGWSAYDRKVILLLMRAVDKVKIKVNVDLCSASS